MNDTEFASMYNCKDIYPDQIRQLLEYAQELRNVKAGMEGQRDAMADKIMALTNAIVPFAWCADTMSALEKKSLEAGASAHYIIATQEDGASKTIVAEDFRRAKAAMESFGADPFKEFMPGCRITITVVFPGEYKIGYTDSRHIYTPGSGSYYKFSEAVKRAVEAYHRDHYIIP